MKNNKRTILIVISFLIMIGIGYTPAPTGLPQEGMKVLGVFAGCLLLWLTVAIDWPSFICVAAIGLMPFTDLKTVLSGAFGNETFVFLLCTFICTYSLSQTNFLRRCALAFVTTKVARKGAWHFTIAFFAAILFIGSFMSPTVLFVIFMPILEEVYKLLGLKKGDRIAEMLMLGLVFTTSISSGMTPIAHVFSIMAIGFYQAATGLSIGYGQYMVFAIPVGIICSILMLLVFKYIYRVDMSSIDKVDLRPLKEEMPKIDSREVLSATIFGLVVAAWVLPSLLKGVFPTISETISSYGTALPPMIGVIVLSVISINSKPLLDFGGAMKNGVPWGSLIMSVGTLAIGSAMTNEAVGLTKYIIDLLGPALSNVSPILLVLLFTIWAAIQTNLSSNMVTVTVVTAVGIPLMLATGGAVNTPAVVCIIGMMGAYAFATPPAMPHVAIAGGSGWTSVSSLFKYGIIQMVISIIVTVIIGYPLACMVM